MKSSVREYAVLYVGKGGASNATTGGGNTTRTPEPAHIRHHPSEHTRL